MQKKYESGLVRRAGATPDEWGIIEAATRAAEQIARLVAGQAADPDALATAEILNDLAEAAAKRRG